MLLVQTLSLLDQHVTMIQRDVEKNLWEVEAGSTKARSRWSRLKIKRKKSSCLRNDRRYYPSVWQRLPLQEHASQIQHVKVRLD